jgi:hypothetical protein
MNYHSKVALTVHLTTGRRGAPNWPPNQPSVADFGSQSCRCRRQTTTKPILPSLLPTAVSVPRSLSPKPNAIEST